MRSRRALSSILVVTLAIFAGCSAPKYDLAPPPQGTALGGKDAQANTAEVAADRMIVWRAYITVMVADKDKAVAEAARIAGACGGFVESRSDGEDHQATLRLRVPVKSFQATVGALDSLGDVTERDIHSDDVTERYIDVDARLKNKIALRDRLKQLLDKAQDVKDILAIEAELNRVQSDIDSMEGRIKALKGQADMATIELTIKRKKILGPLGYLFKGIFWTIGKLFVIRS